MKIAHNAIDMTGKVYNSWKVIKKVDGTGKRTGGVSWIAQCLGCSREYVVKGANIRSGMSKQCVKCGCKHGHDVQKGQTRTKRTSEESAHYYLYLKLRRDARKRKKTWNLNELEVKELVLGDCVYCGEKPSNICSPLKHYGMSQQRTKESILVRNGIDRVNSSLGYIPGNVVPCCEDCNKGKLDKTAENFIAWAYRIVAFQESKK